MPESYWESFERGERMTAQERPWLRFYDEGIPQELVYPQVPLYRLLEEAAARFPENVALDFLGGLGKQITYAQLLTTARRVAANLQVLGLRKGDRVALMLPNVPQYVIAYYGTLMAGGVVVNLNPLYTARELKELLQDARPRFLVMLDFLFPLYQEVEKEVSVQVVFTTGIQDYLRFPFNLLYPIKARREGRWARLGPHPKRRRFGILTQPQAFRPVEVEGDDLAVIQYTGGTTGTPKGATLSHRNLVANVYQVWAWMEGGKNRTDKLRLEEGKEVVLCIIPFFHVYGMTVAMNLGIKQGARLILMPRPDLKQAVALVEKRKVTLMPGVPTLYVGFNQFPGIEKRDISSIKFCISGAAPLPVEVAKRFEELTGAKLIEGYGLSEASPVTHANPLFGKRKVGSIGLPLPGVDAKVVDEAGNEVPTGEAGELVVRGPNVMTGYWNNSEETQKTLKDGWLHTGDIARMDEEGYF
ncbi:long-chain fatty acid--CoA ligase [Thermus sp. FJN-A]